MCNITVINMNTPNKKSELCMLVLWRHLKKNIPYVVNCACMWNNWKLWVPITVVFFIIELYFIYSYMHITDLVTRPWVQFALRASFIQLLPCHFLFSVHISCRPLSLSVAIICFKRNLAQVITLVEEWIDTSGIHNWMDFKSMYRKMAWAGFEPKTTELLSVALTNCAIRPWHRQQNAPSFKPVIHILQCWNLAQLYFT